MTTALRPPLGPAPPDYVEDARLDAARGLDPVPPLVFVTAFRNRSALNKFVAEIAWETEVWVADAPTHMTHFNGERFLGPHGIA